MENDDLGQTKSQNSFNQIDKEKNIDLQQNKKSKTTFVSKRPIQNANETLDIEPLDDKKFVKDNEKLENFEIDDPW